MDALAHRVVGGQGGRGDSRPVRSNPRRASAPRAGLRSCLGILRLGKRYGEVRLEAACNRALRVKARSYWHVESILKNGLDRVATLDEQTTLSLTHENVRGRDYYH